MLISPPETEPGEINFEDFPAGMVRIKIPRLNIRMAPGLDQPVVGSLPAAATVVRAEGPGYQFDGCEWIPIVAWIAKSYNGAPLAEESQNVTK